MVTSESELIETLTKEVEEFRKAREAHTDCARRLDDLEKRPYLTPQDEVDIKILKKKKLVYKDQMERILTQYRKGTTQKK